MLLVLADYTNAGQFFRVLFANLSSGWASNLWMESASIVQSYKQRKIIHQLENQTGSST